MTLLHVCARRQIRTLVANAGGEALARSLGGPDIDWLAAAEAEEEPGKIRGGGDGLEPPAATAAAANAHTARGNLYDGQKISANGIISRVTGSEAEVVRGQRGGGDEQSPSPLLLTMADLEVGEKKLPPPSSSMKMGCPKIPQVTVVGRGIDGGIGDCRSFR